MFLSPPLMAQVDRTVRVEGRQMRVRIMGQPDGAPGRPVVVFESGAGTGVNGWSSVLQDVSQFATVVAYNRAGIGESEADDHAPTPAHVARKLQALLTGIGVNRRTCWSATRGAALLIRMFAAMYPEKVAGLVYVDPTDPRSLEQNLAYLQASGYTAEGAREFLQRHREQMSQFVQAQVGAYRAEMEVIRDAEFGDFAEFRGLPALPSVPVSVLLANRLEAQMWAGRPCVPAACRDAWMARRIRSAEAAGASWARMPRSRSQTRAGHAIQSDQPSLVVSAVRRVLAHRSGR